ncbi:hypothetical protein ACI2UY_22310 [Ralstonia nicotianae]
MATMTRNHYSRLRAYFRCGHRGSPSLADNIDLDLVAAGFIARMDRQFGGAQFVITHAGELELHEEKQREITRRKPHHELAGRLAAWLRDQSRVTWENIELLVDLPTGGRQAIRPDVFSMSTTYDAKRINPCVHEVKVSRSDFLADLAKPEKRGGYAAISEVMYYVAPAGIVDVGEVPPDCGLVVESGVGVFDVLKRPKKRRVELTTHHFMNLILKPGAFHAT